MNKIERILEIDNSSFSQSWSLNDYKKFYRENNTEIIIIEKEKIIGYLVALKLVDTLEIVRIAVDKKYRNQGYGKKLIDIAQDFAIENNYKKIILEFRENNTAARNLYKSAEFKEINIRKKYYKDTLEDAIVMLKEISEND